MGSIFKHNVSSMHFSHTLLVGVLERLLYCCRSIAIRTYGISSLLLHHVSDATTASTVVTSQNSPCSTLKAHSCTSCAQITSSGRSTLRRANVAHASSQSRTANPRFPAIRVVVLTQWVDVMPQITRSVICESRKCAWWKEGRFERSRKGGTVSNRFVQQTL